MHLRPGMKIELVAAEPLVVDPVAFDWGPDGRLWVVEMRDYPNGIDWHKAGDPVGKPGGRVKVLTDTDGDGRYDKASDVSRRDPVPDRREGLAERHPRHRRPGHPLCRGHRRRRQGRRAASRSIAALAKATSSTA